MSLKSQHKHVTTISIAQQSALQTTRGSSMSISIDARGVRKTFRAHNRAGGHVVEVLKGIDLQVASGEMIAIVGPSGSGKSTLLHCLSGLDAPDSGSVILAGEQIVGERAANVSAIRRRHVGFIFQSYNLIPSLTAAENVSIASRLADSPLDAGAIARLFDQLHLKGKEKKKPGQLSGGEQQRVAIARALASKADILFADEPTGALDTKNSKQVLHMLRSMADGERRTVVLVTHDLEAAALADRVLVMKDGRIVRELGPAAPEAILAVMEAAQ